ncbi:MAG: pyridine nucleotide-disulfide oxidoreductase, partial [Ectothiorhodospiraceae bacterium]
MTLDTNLARWGLSFAELQTQKGLEHIDSLFLDRLREHDADLHAGLVQRRNGEAELGPIAESELLIAAARHLEGFVADVFGLQQHLRDATAQTLSHDVVMAFKQEFVARRVKKYRKPVEEDFQSLDRWLSEQIVSAAEEPDRERAVAAYAMELIADADANAEAIERLTAWCKLARQTEEGRRAVAGWSSFKLPEKLDHAHLVPMQQVDADGNVVLQADPSRWRRRDGFGLTDARMDARSVQSEVHYCVYCHDHDGDFCSKGFPEKKGRPELGLKQDPLGVTLTGCPLEEKISEMHVLKRDGRTVAALAMAMVDNPMVPATGHRICNDCMKGCIYQKQDPVNIPQIETRSLTDVLELPWGVEVYHLLTRWNPLRRNQFVQKTDNGRRVLVAGMGPAGFTMAHHLTMEGCTVVGIDGLKIEPLPRELLETPVESWED